MSQATKDKLSRKGKARWAAKSASAKAAAIRHLKGAGGKAKAKAKAAKKIYHRAKRGIFDLSLGEIADAAPAVRGIWRAGVRARDMYRVDQDPIHAVTGIVARSGASLGFDRNAAALIAHPIVNGLADSTYIHKLRVSTLTAPLVKSVANMRPLSSGGLKLPKITPGAVIEALPSAAGWAVSLRTINADPGGAIHIAPNAIAVDWTKAAQRYLPAAAGGVPSKVIHGARVSGLVPAPAKRILNLRIAG